MSQICPCEQYLRRTFRLRPWRVGRSIWQDTRTRSWHELVIILHIIVKWLMQSLRHCVLKCISDFTCSDIVWIWRIPFNDHEANRIRREEITAKCIADVINIDVVLQAKCLTCYLHVVSTSKGKEDFLWNDTTNVYTQLRKERDLHETLVGPMI